MKKMKKLLALVMVIALVGAAIGGTLAYLSDSDGDVNVMTMGSVKIEQNEYQRVEAADGTFTNELEPFKQGKALMPYVSRTNTPDVVTIGDFTATVNDQYANYIDKIVTVTNTGKSDAYVRTLIALPSGGWSDGPAADAWLHWNTWGKNLDGEYEMDETWDSYFDNEALETPTTVTIGDMEYHVFEFVHTAKLAPGVTACPTMTGVYMDCRVNNDDTGYYMDLNSNNKYDEGTDKRIVYPVGEPLVVYVLSQATQTDGFADAFTALDAAFGDVTVENATAWFGGEEFKVPTVVETEDAFKAAVEAGKDVVIGDDIVLTESITVPNEAAIAIDLGGHTITAPAYTSGGYVCAIKNEGTLTIKGKGTVTGSYAAVYSTGNLTVEDGTFTSPTGFGLIIDNIYGTEPSVAVINGGSFDGVGVYNPTDVTINGGTFNVGRDPDGATDHISNKITLLVSPTFTGAPNTATVTLNSGTFKGDIYVYDDGITETAFTNNGATIIGSILDNS